MTTTTNSRTEWYVHTWLGLSAAIVVGATATSIIIQDAFPNGFSDWSHAKPEHYRAPVLVGMTAILWLFAFNLIEWKRTAKWRVPFWPKNVGTTASILAAAIFCSGLVIFESMGRGAESLDTKVAEKTKTVDQYASIAADYERTKGLVKQSETWAAGACASGPGPKCKGETFTLNQRKASAEALKAQLEQAAAPAPVDARGDRVAFFAGLAKLDGKTAKQFAQMAAPIAHGLAYELVFVLLLHVSVKRRTVAVEIVEAKAVEVEAAPVEAPKMLTFEGPFTEEEIDELKRILGTHSELCNKDLAEKVGISAGHMSRRCQQAEAAGIISRRKEGKHVYVSLATSDGKKVAA
jgi:uncharacterized membrane protein